MYSLKNLGMLLTRAAASPVIVQLIKMTVLFPPDMATPPPCKGEGDFSAFTKHFRGFEYCNGSKSWLLTKPAVLQLIVQVVM